jgi:Flp pilus assembly protein TadG
MKMLRAFWKDDAAGPAAEFALVLPIALMFLFGIIDTGRYMWEVSRAEKATQMGARYAVATQSVATGLTDYDFALDCEIPGGNKIEADEFPGMVCTGSGTADAPTASCVAAAASSCAIDIDTAASNDALENILARMRMFKNDIEPSNVTIRYAYSGLGYAGDPNGMDVAPIVTVQVQNLQFNPLLLQLFGGSADFPVLSYSLTMEDGAGSVSN